MMELNVYGEEVALKERGTESRELRGNVLTADENKLTGHLQVLIGDIGRRMATRFPSQLR
jgi:hypothetical protein